MALAAPDSPIRSVRAGVLDVAYREIGPADGWPVVLVHGFPYDALCYAETAALLAGDGARVITPWMRGYGATRFASDETMRSGQQGAFGADLLAFLDALGIGRALLGGFDWGGRAACIVAALWPERVAALVTAMGYNIIDMRKASVPLPPAAEHRLWYMWYFHGRRGPPGLAENRRALTRLLWRLWSPDWDFSDATFAATAAAFDNPDFVDVVIHSYRHRGGLVAGDPAYDEIERRLAARPAIKVPTVIVDGRSDGVSPPPDAPDLTGFAGWRDYRLFAGVGHNPPQEDPRAFADAVLAARAAAAA